MTREELAAVVDHTILKADATERQVREAIEFAKENQTASVCLNPCWVPLAVGLLEGSGVTVCGMVGFPLGADTTPSKAAQAEELYHLGAGEIDMVINIGALKSGLEDYVVADIAAVVAASPVPVTVILETGFLTREEIALGCDLSARAGAAWVQTSTGAGPGGAKVDDVKLMRLASPASLKVKATGGIGSFVDALVMLEAGAERVGASRTAAILGGVGGPVHY